MTKWMALRLPPAFPPSKNRFIKQREYLECALHIGLPVAPTDARHKKRQPRDNQTFLSRFEDNIPHRNKRLVGENLHQKACIIRKALHRGKRVQDSGQCPILSSFDFIWEDLPIAFFRLKTGRFQGTSRKQSVWGKGKVFISSLCSSCVCIVCA